MLFSSAEFAHGVFFCGRCRMNFEKIGLYPASTAYDANSWSIEKPTLAKGNSTAPTFRMTASQTVTRSSTFTRNVCTNGADGTDRTHPRGWDIHAIPHRRHAESTFHQPG